MFGLDRMAQGAGLSFGSIVAAPFEAISAFFGGLVDSLLSGLVATVALGAVALSPGLASKIAGKLGAKDLAEKLAKVEKEEGPKGLLKYAAMFGFGGAALFGGTKATIEGSTGQAPGEGGIGTLIGTGIVMAVVGSVAIGALTNSEVKPADAAAPKSPPPTPAPAAKGQARNN